MATYYIDPVDGSDAGTGTSDSDPWQTWQKVWTEGAWVAGNSVLGKGGTVSPYPIAILAGGSDAATRVTVGAYGTGKHVIDCGNVYCGGIVTACWGNVSFTDISDIEVKNVATRSGHTFLSAATDISFTTAPNYRLVSVTTDLSALGLRLGQWIYVSGFTEAANNGSWQVREISTNYIRVSLKAGTNEDAGDPITIASDYGYGVNMYGLAGSGSNTLSRLYIHDSAYEGIRLNKNGALLVEGCVISDVQTNGINAQFTQDNDGAGTLIISGCVLSGICKSGTSGDGMYFASNLPNHVMVTGCTITYDAAWKNAITLAINASYSARIINNVFLGGETGTSGIQIAQAASAEVIGNSFYGFNGTSTEVTTSGRAMTFYGTATYSGIPTLLVCGNVIENCGYGIAMSGDDGVVNTHEWRLYNNTIKDCGSGFVKNGFARLTLKNNIVSGATTALYVGSDTDTFTADYNDYFPEGADFIENYKDGGGKYSTLVAYQAAAANESNSISGDPLLQSDYSLGAGSPARGAGVWIAGVRAYDDLPLPLHPDIGAVQDRTYPGRVFGAGGGTL